MSCNNCLDNFCTNRCDMEVVPWILTNRIQVSKCGIVWRVKNGYLYRLKPYNNRGILYVDLYNDGGQRRLAEIVLKSFDRKGKGRIQYIDNNTLNCKLENLKWTT